MKIFKCPTCSAKSDHFYLGKVADQYDLLRGAFFEIKILKDGQLQLVGPTNEFADWYEKLNVGFWNDHIQNFLKELDWRAGVLIQCPECYSHHYVGTSDLDDCNGVIIETGEP